MRNGKDKYLSKKILCFGIIMRSPIYVVHCSTNVINHMFSTKAVTGCTSGRSGPRWSQKRSNSTALMVTLVRVVLGPRISPERRKNQPTSSRSFPPPHPSREDSIPSIALSLFFVRKALWLDSGWQRRRRRRRALRGPRRKALRLILQLRRSLPPFLAQNIIE